MGGEAKDLALLGGSFNPPHRTHRRVVETALSALPLDELRVLPAGRNPLKAADPDMAPARHRLAMCRLQFAGIPKVTVDDRELHRAGPSYTVETLEELRSERPGARLWFLIGSDNLASLPHWQSHHRILELCTVATFPRIGHPADAAALAGLDLTPAEREVLLRHVLEMEPDAVSASELRARLRAGARDLPELERAVEEYIRSHHLYGC